MQSTCAACQPKSVAAATERNSGLNVVSRKRIGNNLTDVDYARPKSVSQCTETNAPPDACQSLKLACANADGQGPRSRKAPPPKESQAVGRLGQWRNCPASTSTACAVSILRSERRAVRRASSSVEEGSSIGFHRFSFGVVVLFLKSVLRRQRKLLAILLMAFIPSPNRAMASRWRSNSP